MSKECKSKSVFFALAVLALAALACGPDRVRLFASATPEAAGTSGSATAAAPAGEPPSPTAQGAAGVPEIATSVAPTSEPGGPGLTVRGGRMYISSFDLLHVVGEVVNDAGRAYDHVKVVASFYDAEGRMLGADAAATYPRVLPPHSVGVFDLVSDVGGAAGDVVAYELQVEGMVTSEEPYGGLEAVAGRDFTEHYFYLPGEVRNTGGANCEFVRVVAAFYDAEGTVVAVAPTVALKDVVPAGGKAPFELSAAGVPEFDRYELWVEGTPTGKEPYAGFEIDVGREYEAHGAYHLVGRVVNTGDRAYESVRVLATFYDAEGRVVRVGFAFTELDVVPAGGSSPFDVLVGDLPAFDHYELWAEGAPAGG